ncbi:hypothetical protein HDV05_000689 [Chytridiales sp. JEL 0842]|nr:hypothetical protein HDV05_000689 [Chytridiales sp. JEL 0842]
MLKKNIKISRKKAINARKGYDWESDNSDYSEDELIEALSNAKWVVAPVEQPMTDNDDRHSSSADETLKQASNEKKMHSIAIVRDWKDNVVVQDGTSSTSANNTALAASIQGQVTAHTSFVGRGALLNAPQAAAYYDQVPNDRKLKLVSEPVQIPVDHPVKMFCDKMKFERETILEPFFQDLETHLRRLGAL